jgi:hypothetical protein
MLGVMLFRKTISVLATVEAILTEAPCFWKRDLSVHIVGPHNFDPGFWLGYWCAA